MHVGCFRAFHVAHPILRLVSRLTPAPVNRAKFTILFSHANAEDLGLIYEHLKTLSEVLQVNVMGYEYTGYGRSTGVPSEANCYADIVAAFSWLLKEKNLLPSEVILFGRSIGSGPTVELASRAEVGGVILQSAFTSCIRVAYDVKHTVFDVFCNIKKVHKIKCPVLILRAPEGMTTPDNILLPEQALDKMSRDIPDARYVDIAGSNHYSIVMQPDKGRDKAILDFLA